MPLQPCWEFWSQYTILHSSKSHRKVFSKAVFKVWKRDDNFGKSEHWKFNHHKPSIDERKGQAPNHGHKWSKRGNGSSGNISWNFMEILQRSLLTCLGKPRSKHCSFQGRCHIISFCTSPFYKALFQIPGKFKLQSSEIDDWKLLPRSETPVS